MKELNIVSDRVNKETAIVNIKFLAWVFIWVSSMVLADKAELYGWYTAEYMSIAAIIINLLLGLGMILAFISYLKFFDELQRKIQLDALAFSMGVTLVGSFTYSLLITAGYIPYPEISVIILITTGAYMAGVLFGNFRFR